MKLNEAIMRNPGELIPELTVRLGEVANRYVGKGTYGVYSFQNAKATDDTGAIGILLKNRADMALDDGELVKLSSTLRKNVLKGIKIANDKKTGAKVIEISGHASVHIITSAGELKKTVPLTSDADYVASQGGTVSSSGASYTAKNGTQKSIEKQNALKCATRLVSAMVDGEDKGDGEAIVDVVIKMAEKLYAWHATETPVEEEIKEEQVVKEEDEESEVPF